MLDYKLLEALAFVVREGGFEKAARALNLTQSAVSQRVRQLEDHCGQVLLARTTPPGPTQAGREMLRHYQQVRRLEEDLWQAVVPAETPAFVSLAVGVNADSLATWFLEAVGAFLRQRRVVLDLRVDDQEATQRMLKDGEVLGCVSAEPRPMQGCRAVRLGRMVYRLLASPDFAAQWFPGGVTLESAAQAPMLRYSPKDRLQESLLRMALGQMPQGAPLLCVPSTEGFVAAILAGLAHGSVPDQHSRPHLERGAMVDLLPHCQVGVELYWHCPNIRSRLLEDFTAALVAGARRLLPEDGADEGLSTGSNRPDHCQTPAGG